MSNWKEKIKPGLMYRIGNVDTGYQGAIDFGIALERRRLSDEEIQNSIKVFFNGEWVSLSDISVERQGSIPGKIPTAYQFCQSNSLVLTGGQADPQIEKALIEFAKLHLKQAITEAYTGKNSSQEDINKLRILDKYLETNIK